MALHIVKTLFVIAASMFNLRVGDWRGSTIHGLHTIKTPSRSHLDRIAATLSLLLITFIVCKAFYRRRFHPLARFPGPTFAATTKLFELYHVLIKNDWMKTLQHLHQQYGPIVRIGPNELHCADHEFCLEHHKRADLMKCDKYYGLLDKLMGGIASPKMHSERKSKIQPLFTGLTLQKFSATMMNDHLETLHDQLVIYASTGAEVNVTHHLWAYTNDIMFSYLFGEDMGYLKKADLAKVHNALRAFSAIDLATLLRAIPPLKKTLDIFPALRHFSPLGWLDQLVGSRLAPLVNPELDGKLSKVSKNVLARLWGQLGDEQLVVQEVSQAIFIGNESLLSNLTFLLHHIIQNPNCVKKLRVELDTLDIGLYGHQVWRDPKVIRLSYLDALCRESTRLSSPSWHRQPRQISEHVNYRGWVIPPMTSISFTPQMLEHDPVLFPEPNAFKPDRWLGSGQEAQNARRCSVTFGTGTRTCLGQSISQHVLRKTLACLVYNFDISFWDEEADKKGGYRYLNTYPKKGHEGFLKVQLMPRWVQGEF